MNDGDLLKELRIQPSHRDDDEGTSRWPWLVGALVALLAIGVGAWWWYGQRAIEVETVTAISQAAADGTTAVLQATGYVTARRQATVSAQIVGTLSEVLIEEGDHVKKGQVLARLEDSAYKAQLDAAKATAEAVEAQVGQARAELSQGKRDLDRADDLVGRGLVSRQAAEQARTRVTTLAAQLNAQVMQAAAARAQAHAAHVNFDYTVVRAPFDGVIINKSAQVGEIISPMAAGGGFTRTGVGTIVDMDSLEVDVDVNEAYIGRVEPNMPAEAVLDAYPDWTIPAHVIAIVPAADRGKATVKVRVALEQRDARIVPDMGVRVSFLEERASPTAAPPKGVLIPASAIVKRSGRNVVFAIEAGTAHQRNVTPAAQDYSGMKLVPSGVPAGTRIVDKPTDSLHDGTRVKNDK